MLLLNALAAAPALHEWFHADAGHSEHQCAVTLFAHGQMEAGAAVASAAIPALAGEFNLPSLVSVFGTAAETLPPGRGPPLAPLNS